MREASDGADEAMCVLNGRYLHEAVMDVMGNPRLSAVAGCIHELQCEGLDDLESRGVGGDDRECSAG